MIIVIIWQKLKKIEDSWKRNDWIGYFLEVCAVLHMLPLALSIFYAAKLMGGVGTLVILVYVVTTVWWAFLGSRILDSGTYVEISYEDPWKESC